MALGQKLIATGGICVAIMVVMFAVGVFTTLVNEDKKYERALRVLSAIAAWSFIIGVLLAVVGGVVWVWF